MKIEDFVYDFNGESTFGANYTGIYRVDITDENILFISKLIANKHIKLINDRIDDEWYRYIFKSQAKQDAEAITPEYCLISNNKDMSRSYLVGKLDIVEGSGIKKQYDLHKYSSGIDGIKGMIPHKCPICYGTSYVPAGFYSKGISGTDPAQVKCKSCINGLVWG
jgi:hypothetical protein